MYSKILSIFIILIICTGCKGQGNQLYASAEPIPIYRFDKDLYQLIQSKDTILEKQLLSKYPEMLEVLGMGVFNMQSTEAPGFFERIIRYYLEPTLNGLYQDAITLYNTIEDIEQQLGSGFAYLQDHFPTMQMPKVYMHVSGLNQNVLVAEGLLSISIDKYMGKDYPLYQEFFYDYQRVKMQPSYIVPDYLSGWLLSEFPFSGKENVLLDRMIYEGKIKYLVAQALPDKTAEELLGYSKETLDWCKANEGELWKAIIERKHLYTPDYMVTTKYFEEAPNNPLSQEAPGNLGIWLGWRIVEKYMKETNATPDALMKQNDAQEILTGSKYKPL